MSREDARCVALMTRTSWRNERDYLADCAHCARPFWCRAWNGRYCSASCRTLACLRNGRRRLVAA